MATPMTAVELLDEDELQRRITDARLKLGDLDSLLQSIDGELEVLGDQRQTWEMLEQAIGSVERLDEAGVAHLFWGEGAKEKTAEHMRGVRERADVHLGRIGETQQRRDAVEQEIFEGEELLELLETDLYELRIEEEERAQEWHVERESHDPVRAVIMPWGGTLEDRQRLRKSLSLSLLCALVLGSIIPLIDLPLPELDLIPEVPERFANLIERQLPPPPPPQPIVEEAPPEEPVPEEPQLVEEQPEELPVIPEEPTVPVAEEPAPEQQVRSAGILAFRESISNIDRREPAQLGARAEVNDAGEAAVGRTERAMVASQAPGSSGGINLSELSRNVSGSSGEGLDGVAVSRVASSIGVSGNGDRPVAAGALAGRTDEEIQIVFDRYKSALYRLYNRELRNDPSLRGQMVLRLTIEPDGSVSFCQVQSSDMGAAALEQQIVDRVLTFDFGAREGISEVTILYPIDFLPAG